MNPLTPDRAALGTTRRMPRITSPYSTAPRPPARTIIFGTSRCGSIISSDAPLEVSKPTHKNTRMEIAVRNPFKEGLMSPAVEAPAGRPCWMR